MAWALVYFLLTGASPLWCQIDPRASADASSRLECLATSALSQEILKYWHPTCLDYRGRQSPPPSLRGIVI